MGQWRGGLDLQLHMHALCGIFVERITRMAANASSTSDAL